MASRQQWMHFGELFAEAEARGIDPLRVAQLLLKRAAAEHNPMRVEGLRRQYDDDAQAWRARETHWRLVPPEAWATLDSIGPDGQSHWSDDEEKPRQWTSVDWFAGSLVRNAIGWDDAGDGYGYLRFDPTEEFAPLRIERTAAERLLAAVEGRAMPRRGRPPGMSNPVEQEQLAAALAARADGDLRNDHALATAFACREDVQTEDEFNKSRDRLYDQLRAAAKSSKNATQK